MSLLFVCCYVFYCAFNVCAFDRCDKVVRKMHPFEEDRPVSWFLHPSPDAIPGGSVDGVEGCGQCVVVKDENGDVVQLESDEQFYKECVSIEFFLPA